MSFCIGKVLGYGQKEHASTLKVEIFAMGNEEKSIVNIELQQLYAGKNHGVLFLPEVGDLVRVEMDDHHRPIGIMSAVFDSNSNLLNKSNEQNDLKTMVTTSGNEVCFDDANETIKIKTVKDNHILLDNKNDEIKIEANSDIKIICDENNIHISQNEIEIKSQYNLTLSCGRSKITLKNDGISIEGVNIKIKGTTKTEVESNILNFSSMMTNFK